MKGNVDKFWKAHAKSPICKNNMKAKDENVIYFCVFVKSLSPASMCSCRSHFS